MSKAADRLFRKWPLETWWRFVNVGALGVGSAFLASVAFTYNFDQNPLLWRVFSPKNISIGPGNHHTLIMIALGLTFYASVKWGVNPLLAVIGTYFLVEAHEAEWYVTYVVWKLFDNGGLFQWSWMLITVLMVPILAVYFLLFGFPWRFFAWMAPFYAAWLAAGFPITQDFYQHTVLYDDLFTNGFWELGVWVWAVVGFFLFVFPRLKKASEVFKMKWWVH